jgi:hypothetical protein
VLNDERSKLRAQPRRSRDSLQPAPYVREERAVSGSRGPQQRGHLGTRAGPMSANRCMLCERDTEANEWHR